MKQSIDNVLKKSWQGFGKVCNFECFTTHENVILFKSFIPSVGFNCAYTDENIDVQIVMDFFEGLPFSFIVHESCDFLSQNKNFVKTESWKGMELISKTEKVPNVLLVNDDITCQHCIDVMSEGFGMAPSLVEQFVKPLISIEDQRVFVVYDGKKPVSTGVLSLCGNSAMIAYLTTKSDKRRLGFGTKLIKHLCSYAFEKGCENI